MPKKISEETKQLIETLYNESLSVAEIARRTGISYPTAYGYSRVRQRINPETGKTFASRTEYLEHLARQRINPETGERFVSLTEYQEHLARQRINPETGERFVSLTEYQEHLTRQRQQRPINQELSDLIKRRLSELGKNQVWLAEEIGVTKQAVSFYIKGQNIPSKDGLSRLYSALEVPYRTLDDLV